MKFSLRVQYERGAHRFDRRETQIGEPAGRLNKYQQTFFTLGLIQVAWLVKLHKTLIWSFVDPPLGSTRYSPVLIRKSHSKGNGVAKLKVPIYALYVKYFNQNFRQKNVWGISEDFLDPRNSFKSHHNTLSTNFTCTLPAPIHRKTNSKQVNLCFVKDRPLQAGVNL